MDRIGVYTGKIYSQEDYNNGSIKECTMCVSPTGGENALEKTQERARIRKLLYCPECNDCEESRKNE